MLGCVLLQANAVHNSWVHIRSAAFSCLQLGECGHHGEPVPAHLNVQRGWHPA